MLHKRYEMVLHEWGGVGRRIKFNMHKFAPMLSLLSPVAPMLSSRASSILYFFVGILL